MHVSLRGIPRLPDGDAGWRRTGSLRHDGREFRKPTWSDTAVAYLAFYHLIAKGKTIEEAVEAMAAASGDPHWVVETAIESKQSFLDFLKAETTPAEVQQQLAAVAEELPIPLTAQALEAGASI